MNLLNFQRAEDSLRFYKGCRKENIDDAVAVHNEFQRLKAIATEQKTDEKITLKDICNELLSHFLFTGQ